MKIENGEEDDGNKLSSIGEGHIKKWIPLEVVTAQNNYKLYIKLYEVMITILKQTSLNH